MNPFVYPGEVIFKNVNTILQGGGEIKNKEAHWNPCHFLINVCKKNNNKIRPSTFEDIIGFIKWCMNQTASHLASREMLHWAVGEERFLKTERAPKKEIVSKECIVLVKAASYREQKGTVPVTCPSLWLSAEGEAVPAGPSLQPHIWICNGSLASEPILPYVQVSLVQ